MGWKEYCTEDSSVKYDACTVWLLCIRQRSRIPHFDNLLIVSEEMQSVKQGLSSFRRKLTAAVCDSGRGSGNTVLEFLMNSPEEQILMRVLSWCGLSFVF